MGTCFGTSVPKHGEPRRVKPVGFTRFWALRILIFGPSCQPNSIGLPEGVRRATTCRAPAGDSYAAIWSCSRATWLLSLSEIDGAFAGKVLGRGKSKREASTNTPSAR